jgi:hypothetical protein
MSVKLLSESSEATITDEDQLRIDAVLTFWFREQRLSAPQIDQRMDIQRLRPRLQESVFRRCRTGF